MGKRGGGGLGVRWRWGKGVRMGGWDVGGTWGVVSSWEAIPEQPLDSAPACQRDWHKNILPG